jgi:DNA-binding transcriptional MocR family regulator
MQPMDPAPPWVGRFAPGGGPRYLQIVAFLERGIAEGLLHPGDRLPAQRRLADALGCDLTTVTRAYDEARRRHFLEARGPAGTFVAAPRVDLTRMVDLSMNIPPPPSTVDLEDLLKAGLSQVILHADVDLLMTYHLGGGSAPDRGAGVQWLAPMLGNVDPDRLVACPGAQSALAALILALSAPGDVILSEPLIYPGLRAAARMLGRRVEDVPVDDEGMRPEALERACRAHRAKVIYLNPTIQNPTTVTMPEGRRRAILDIAHRHGAMIIEDDPYWLLADSPPPPLARLAPERVHYISTLSKCLSPGLRTAFVVLPDVHGQARFLDALRSFSWMRTPLTAALVTQWIHDGSAARLLAGVRAESRERQRLVSQTLGSPVAGAHASRDGIHVWHMLPSYWASEDLANAARAEGLAVTPSTAFAAAATTPPNAIRISLGEGSDRARLATALKQLSRLLARIPSNTRPPVV